jgi:hypothetical protein
MPVNGTHMDVGFASGRVMGSLTKSPKNPVLRRPASGWSSGQVSMPRVVKQGAYYYAIHEGATLDYTCDVANRYGWGLARSTDLVTWDPYPGNPIAQSSQQGVGCGNDMPQPFIRYDNEVFVYHTSADSRRIVRDHLVMK